MQMCAITMLDPPRPLIAQRDFIIHSRTTIFRRNKGPNPDMTFQYEFQPCDMFDSCYRQKSCFSGDKQGQL